MTYLVNVVVAESPTVFELLPGEAQPVPPECHSLRPHSEFPWVLASADQGEC